MEVNIQINKQENFPQPEETQKKYFKILKNKIKRKLPAKLSFKKWLLRKNMLEKMRNGQNDFLNKEISQQNSSQKVLDSNNNNVKKRGRKVGWRKNMAKPKNQQKIIKTRNLVNLSCKIEEDSSQTSNNFLHYHSKSINFFTFV